MVTLTDIKKRPATSRPVLIKPNASVQVKNEHQRAEIKTVAQRVMTEHHDVLLALKNR